MSATKETRVWEIDEGWESRGLVGNNEKHRLLSRVATEPWHCQHSWNMFIFLEIRVGMDIMLVHLHYLVLERRTPQQGVSSVVVIHVLAASSLAEGANTTQQIKICNFHAGGQHPFCIAAMLIQQYDCQHFPLSVHRGQCMSCLHCPFSW